MLQKKEKPTKDLNQQELLDILATGVEEIDRKEEIIDDIDSILKKGEEKTRDFESQLERVNLQDLTIKSNHKYSYCEENVLINKIVKNIPQQETKRRKTHFLTKLKPEMPKLPFYQFYPLELKDLQQKELDCYEKDIEFPEEDRIRKRELLMQGFDWTKKDYNIFIKGMCSIGKDEVEKIAELLEKDKEEVRKYHKIFWERISEVPDYEKIKNQIEKAADQVK